LSKPENIFEIIAKRDAQAFIEVVDEAFKSAAREASLRAHQKGIKVADGRAEEDRRPKPVKPDLQAPTLRAFFRLAEVWGLSDDEQMKLLATTDQRTLQAWKRAMFLTVAAILCCGFRTC
jgi:hypothetical protein